MLNNSMAAFKEIDRNIVEEKGMQRKGKGRERQTWTARVAMMLCAWTREGLPR